MYPLQKMAFFFCNTHLEGSVFMCKTPKIVTNVYLLVSGFPFPCAEVVSADGWQSSREPGSLLLFFLVSLQVTGCVPWAKDPSDGPDWRPRHKETEAAAQWQESHLKDQ